MAANRDKVDQWKADVEQSVDMYNDWFINFAPKTFRDARSSATTAVEAAFKTTDYLRDLGPALLREHPEILPTLRMATAPPLARDRLIGLAKVSRNLVQTMEQERRVPPRMADAELQSQLGRVGDLFQRLFDVDILTWIEEKRSPAGVEVYRASTIVADRLCGAASDPIIRNAQEQRQLERIRVWLEGREYRFVGGEGFRFDTLEPGTFAFRVNVPVYPEASERTVNIPVDVCVKFAKGGSERFPLLIEAKSAGDFTNTNKRRKEEAQKLRQLRETYGDNVAYVLFLCGYFDAGYLGYEASEGIDWVWEHRIDDLEILGL